MYDSLVVFVVDSRLSFCQHLNLKCYIENETYGINELDYSVFEGYQFNQAIVQSCVIGMLIDIVNYTKLK